MIYKVTITALFDEFDYLENINPVEFTKVVKSQMLGKSSNVDFPAETNVLVEPYGTTNTQKEE